MNVEQARLETFQLWPMESPEISRIAKYGFFATGNGLEVQCHWCATKISEWAHVDQVSVLIVTYTYIMYTYIYIYNNLTLHG